MLLVIGATGHTGRYFLQELKNNNYNEKVRFLVRDNSSENIFKEYNLNYETIQGDLNNKDDLQMTVGEKAKIQPVNARNLGKAF